MALLCAAAAALPAARAAAPRPPDARPPSSPAPGPERSTRQLLQAGTLAIEAGDWQGAAARFQEAADIDPRLPQARFGLALASLGQRDRRGAERALRAAEELAPGSAEVRYAIGVTGFAFGDERASEALLKGAADADGRFVEARYALGVAAAARGGLAEAEAAFRDALRLDGLHPSSQYMLGAVLARRGDLEGATGELSRAIQRQPELREARPDDAIEFAARDVPPAAASGTLGLPLPVLRPSLGWARRRPGTDPAGIPDWYLYYQMALQLEDAGQWQGSVDMMQRALQQKERSEALAVVANRLVDYSPHVHLASAYHELGNFREAFLHLGIAKNEGNASPEALRALGVLVQKDRLRPRILLDPLPDRTTDQAITVRGVVLADEPVRRVEISGREALLRPATPQEVGDRLPETDKAMARDGVEGVLFEVSGQRLAEGENVIAVRPFFRNPARDGDVLEARVVRAPAAPPAAPPAPPAKPAPPKGAPHGAPPRPAPPRGAAPKPPGGGAP